MLFNSLEFAFFLPIVFLAYWFGVKQNIKAQNILLLFASYFFYGWWDLRFLFLLILLSFLNYLIGIRLDKNETDKEKKIWLIAGLILNLGILIVFKYYNFFIDSFINFVSLFGYHLPKSNTRIILPLGISFYVFLSLSYIIDVYKKRLTANRNIIEVLLSLSFFPIILAGPIQRPFSLLPQISKKREFDYLTAVDGLKQIVWGLFAKIAIADKFASYIDNVFLNSSDYSGSTLLIGILLYTIQIYADFSGYSNIAIGTAKLFGFRLMRNFAYPYFSRDITEFWKRWHISLTTWFRDYVFLPLSFSVSWRIKNSTVFYIKTDLFIYIVAGTITWFLTGLWHGANYTFILWGMIHCFFLILYHWQQKPRKRLFKKLGITNDHSLVVITETIITLFIVMIAWIFFRANSIHEAIKYIDEMISFSLFSVPQVAPVNVSILAVLFIFSEWLQRKKEHALQIDNLKVRIVRWIIYYGVVFLILLTLNDSQQSFIYSQF
jgi:D-alanyl-lipoteichoic acid acyltransferase DltB (MBOAT superfamily)